MDERTNTMNNQLPRTAVTRSLKRAGLYTYKTAQRGDLVKVIVHEIEKQKALQVFHVQGFRVPFIWNNDGIVEIHVGMAN
jgi:hypothetical protein